MNYLKINFNDIKVQKKWDYKKLMWDTYSDIDANWSNIILHKDNDPHLILDLGYNVKYQINWDDGGKIISAYEIE